MLSLKHSSNISNKDFILFVSRGIKTEKLNQGRIDLGGTEYYSSIRG